MIDKDLAIIVSVTTFLLFGLFLAIVHFIRRSDPSERGNPDLKDYKEINVVATLEYFFRKMKERRNRKRQK